MSAKSLRMLLSISTAMLVATSAHAWDPNEGANDYPTQQSFGTTRPSAPLPNSVVPRRFYSDPYAARPAQPANVYSAPVQYAAPVRTPLPAPAPASAVTYYAPAPAYAPAPTGTIPAPMPVQPMVAAGATYQPTGGAPAGVSSYNAPAPAYATPSDYAATSGGAMMAQQPIVQPNPAPAYPMPVQPAPVYAPGYSYQPAETSSYTAGTRTKPDRYSVGVEAFYDNYREPTATVDEKAFYGSLEAGWEHYFSNAWYSSLEGRVSYGRDNYKSASGSAHDIPQWDSDLRMMAGLDLPYAISRFKVYGGLGTTYYRDESKGVLTNLGYSGYDRRIFHLYAPLGMTYEFGGYGLLFAPNIEFDPLLFGNVSTRTQNVPGYSSANFVQDIFTGYGIRGELAVSKMNADGTGWQVSPFVRYWNINDSQTQIIETPGGAAYYLEPENNRLQTGVKMKYLF